MKKFNRVSEVMDSAEYLETDFKDIIELAKGCRFSSCTHTTEQGCEVKAAISEGTLSVERFDDYYRLIKEADYVSRKKNKTKAVDYMRKLTLFRKK